MPRFCRYCGESLKNPEARFCPACGRDLVPSSAPAEDVADHAAPQLHIRVLGEGVRTVALEQIVYAIGRDPTSGIALEQEYVSWHHGRLERRDGAWHYVDLDSTNGTYVNGTKMQSTELRDGDILRIGDVQGNSVGLTFRTSEASEASQPMGSTIRMGAELANKPVLTVGRDPQSDIPLTSPTVSWNHAQIARIEQGHIVTDLRSVNGTFVNGQRVEGAYTLRQGDVVQIGPFKLVYEATGFQQYTAESGVRLDGVHLVREVGKAGKTEAHPQRHQYLGLST